MFGSLGPLEISLIVAVVVLLFGVSLVVQTLRGRLHHWLCWAARERAEARHVDRAVIDIDRCAFERSANRLNASAQAITQEVLKHSEI